MTFCVQASISAPETKNVLYSGGKSTGSLKIVRQRSFTGLATSRNLPRRSYSTVEAIIYQFCTMTRPVSDEEIERVVWEVIKTADLQKLTPKLIREHVLKVLGKERLQRDDSVLKMLVKGMIPRLMSRRGDEEDDERCQEQPGRKRENDEGKPEESEKSEHVSAAPNEHNVKSPDKHAESAGVGRRKSKKKVFEESESSGEDVPSLLQPPSATNNDTPNSEAHHPVAENGGNEASSMLEPITKTDSRDDVKSGSGTREQSSDEEVSEGEPDSPPRKKNAGLKRKRSVKTPKLAKMLKVARELGCRIPPAVLRGKNEDMQKLMACREYLMTKGVESDVLRMRASAIEELREKLDREKELRDLDVDNIIDGSPQSRRRTRGKATRFNSSELSSEGDKPRTDGSGIGSESESSVDSSESEFVITQ